jgi:hypothetical protein
MASDKSAQFAADTKEKELAHKLPDPFVDPRTDREQLLAGPGPHRPTQRQFGGNFITQTPDEDLKMKMKSQFARDEKQLGQTMIEGKDYDYLLKKHKQERYLKTLNFYDQVFDLRDPYQVQTMIKRLGRFQKHKKK